MPDRKYHPYYRAPSVYDRLLIHTPEILAAVLGILLSAIHVFAPNVELSVRELPAFMNYSLTVTMTVGSLLWIWASLTTFSTINKYWLWLRWGLTLSGFSWFAYFIATIGLRPQAVTVWVTYLVISMVPTSVWFVSFATEKAIRKRHGE